MAEAQPGPIRHKCNAKSGSSLAALTEMFIQMTLRFMPYQFTSRRAILAASLAIAMFPIAYAQTAKPATPAPESAYPGTVVEDVVARVNDQVISRSDYERAAQDLDNQAKQQNWTQQQLYEQKRELLRDLIDQQLLISRGKALDISGETELVKRLDEMRKENHLDSMEDLQKAAEAQGVSWEDFKASTRNRIVTQQVIRDEVGRHVNITPTEVQKYYNDHKQEFDQPEQVKLSEILIPTANPDDAAQVAAAKTKADDVAAKLKAGGDFTALAKSSSGGPTAAQGGDLGDFKRGQLAKVLEDQTFNLKPGQYTEPIRTKQGFVILKVIEHTPAGIAPLKDVQPQVEDALGMAKMAPALRDYLTKLREDAYIEIKAGYEDSGASPNEMKPVYSAYAPPTPKKKKHIERTRFKERGRNASKPVPTQTAETAAPAAPAPPAAVPSLADVPQGNAPATSTAADGSATVASSTPVSTSASSSNSSKQIASSNQTTMKPGKKEKIRFGQAPRETLPTATTKTEDAGAGAVSDTQVAANNAPSDLRTMNPDGSIANPEQPDVAKPKTRLQDRAKLPKQKKDKGPKVDPFAPPPVTQDEVATQKQQATPLGLNGATSKNKTPNPSKTGPKRRMTDEKKNGEEPATTATPGGDSGSPSATPAPAATPAPHN